MAGTPLGHLKAEDLFINALVSQWNTVCSTASAHPRIDCTSRVGRQQATGFDPETGRLCCREKVDTPSIAGTRWRNPPTVRRASRSGN